MYASHLNMEITDLWYAFKMMYEKKKNKLTRTGSAAFPKTSKH